MKPSNCRECARRRARLQFSRVEELEEFRDVGGLRFQEGRSTEVVTVHRQIVPVGLYRVVRGALFDAQILKEPFNPLFVRHMNCAAAGIRMLLPYLSCWLAWQRATPQVPATVTAVPRRNKLS